MALIDSVARDPFLRALNGYHGEDIQRAAEQALVDPDGRGVLVILHDGGHRAQLSRLVGYGRISVREATSGPLG